VGLNGYRTVGAFAFLGMVKEAPMQNIPSGVLEKVSAPDHIKGHTASSQLAMGNHWATLNLGMFSTPIRA